MMRTVLIQGIPARKAGGFQGTGEINQLHGAGGFCAPFTLVEIGAMAVAATPRGSTAENVLRNVKIGEIIASVAYRTTYDPKYLCRCATKCDETGKTGTYPN